MERDGNEGKELELHSLHFEGRLVKKMRPILDK